MPEPKRKSLGGKANAWQQKMLIHGEGERYGQPYRLLPWHREFNWRWYELDETDEGRVWWYDEGLIGAEAGAVKTEFVAACGILELAGPAPFQRLAPVITMAAASRDQARELFRQAQYMAGGENDNRIEKAPLCGFFNVYNDEITHADGRPGRIQRVAAVAATAEGGKETLLLGDELHEWTGAKARVWTVRAKSLTKRFTNPGRALGLSTAAAGRGSFPAEDHDPLLWRLYARGVEERNDPLSRFLFSWTEAPAAIEMQRNDPAALRAALEGMRAADVAWRVDVRLNEILKRKIPWTEALRYYMNRFILMAVDSWLNEIPGVWEECYDENAAPADGSEVVVGIDMALKFDSVGVVVAGVLPDGRVGLWTKHFPPVDGRIDHLAVFDFVSGVVADRWTVKAVAYDPRFFELPSRVLEENGFNVVEAKQSPERLVPADSLMYQLLVHHKLAHLNDSVFNQHAGNACWRNSEHGRYLSKGLTKGHMDLVRAASIAIHELLVGEPEFEDFVMTLDTDRMPG